MQQNLQLQFQLHISQNRGTKNDRTLEFQRPGVQLVSSLTDSEISVKKKYPFKASLHSLRSPPQVSSHPQQATTPYSPPTLITHSHKPQIKHLIHLQTILAIYPTSTPTHHAPTHSIPKQQHIRFAPYPSGCATSNLTSRLASPCLAAIFSAHTAPPS